jgi:hypothetical protein
MANNYERIVRQIQWERSKPYSKIRHRLICSWRGHRLVPVEMTEEAHKVAYLHRQACDLYECERCHGRTYR